MLNWLRGVYPDHKFDLNRIKQADKPSINFLSASQVDVTEVKTAAQIFIPQTILTENTHRHTCTQKKTEQLATKAQDVLGTHAH